MSDTNWEKMKEVAQNDLSALRTAETSYGDDLSYVRTKRKSN